MNILNAINLLGKELEGSVATALLVLMIIQLVLVLLAVVVFVLLSARLKKEPKTVRTLLGITLDTNAAKLEFGVGEKFSGEGLIVTANYNEAPYAEILTQLALCPYNATQEEKTKLEAQSLPVVYVPNMGVEGKKTVVVTYGNKGAAYGISVGAVAGKNCVAAEEARKVTNITLETGIVQREFFAGDEFNCEGLIVLAHYNKPPYVEMANSFRVQVPDMIDEGKKAVNVYYGSFAASYGISILPVPEELEEEVVAPIAAPVKEYVPETKVEEVVAEPVQEEVAPVEAYIAEPIVTEFELRESGKIRYDRSYTARLIQSGDALKQWYTELKNELLSYKKVKSHISWTHETFYVGHEQFATLSFRGNTLCLSLPLEPVEFKDTKYELEGASDDSKSAELSALYRIKNARRVKYAMELIALVANGMGLPRVERESEDFYLPYEGLVQLINKGLIKRILDDVADQELVFVEVPVAAAGKGSIEVSEYEFYEPVVSSEPAEAEKPVEAVMPTETAEAEVAVAEAEPYVEEPAPVEEEVVEESAPVEEEVVEEPAPVEEEVIVEEPAPIEEEVVVEEVVPVEEEVVEEEPALVEEEAVEESAPVEEEVVEEVVPVEEEVVEEVVPVEEEAVEEPAPVEEEVVEEVTPVEEEVVEELAPVEEEVVEEVAPVEEEVVEEPAPVEEEVVEEPVLVEEEVVEEEPAPVEEEAVEEPAPVEEEVVEESAPVEEEVVEEPAPVEEVVEEIVLIEEEVVEEPAPVEEVVEEIVLIEEEVVEEPAPVEEAIEEPVVLEEVEVVEETISDEEEVVGEIISLEEPEAEEVVEQVEEFVVLEEVAATEEPEEEEEVIITPEEAGSLAEPSMAKRGPSLSEKRRKNRRKHR